LKNENNEVGLEVVDTRSTLFPAFSHLLVAIVLRLVSDSNVNGESKAPNDYWDGNGDHSWSYAHVVEHNSHYLNDCIWDDEGKTPHGIDVTIISFSKNLAK